MKYIWQKSGWTKFTWDEQVVSTSLVELEALHKELLQKISDLNLKDIGEVLANEVLKTSSIEGEELDIGDVRSSVAKRLGIETAGLPTPLKSTVGIVEMLLDATENFNRCLSLDVLNHWHTLLFSNRDVGLGESDIGVVRTSKEPMKVISGPMGRERVHYIAPSADSLGEELNNFLIWFNREEKESSGFVRAAIAHFWFVTIHPYEDGNGRISRCITDMAVAQYESSRNRYYSLSSQIRKDRKSYYKVLEKTQKGDGDLTNWLKWFLDTVYKAVDESVIGISKSIFLGQFYQAISELSFNSRQRKVIKKLVEAFPYDFEGGLTNKKYVAITKTSPESAKRDLKDLLEKKIILKNKGGGRSTSYQLNREAPKEL